jgi:uncharacterized repeat protein (TIGR02059 family)
MRHSLILLFFCYSLSISGATYYVATTGNDNNPGTITSPWLTWQKGFNSISAGDILYIRGGTYTPAGIVIADVFAAVGVNGKNGTSGSQYQVYAYPGEIPVLDCSTLTNNSYVRIGIMLTNSSYWHLMGLEIKNCNQVTASSPHYGGQGVYITGSSNIIIENCAAHNNQGPGMGTRDVNELTFLNCDSHDNYDPYSDIPGDNADGFDIGFNKNNGIVRCTGCRSWNNSDDGFDMYQDSGYSGIYYLTNCWSWHQGYRSDGVTTGGDGNGFKYGADLQSYDGVTKRYSYNCIAYANRCRGFSQESANVKMVIYNSVAYLNELEGYSFVTYNLADILKNNISYSNGSANVFQSNQTRSNNSWQGGLVVSAADFASIDGTELALPRKADGSLPDMNFLHLVTGSDLIDAGIDVGIPFSGKGPDLGPFETQSASTNPIPAFTSAAVENATPSLLEMTYNMTLANIIPATSAFSVLVNSVVRTVNTVVISGTKVQLTLASPIVYGDVVTVAYTKPTGNPLQTASGGQAVSISAQAVNNKVNSVNPVYVSSSVENATPSILGITYNMTLSSIVPASSAFSVLVNSVVRTIKTVVISGTKVQLTLAIPIIYGDVVIVSYTKPSANPLQTTSGGIAANISNQPVINNCINLAPVAVITSPINYSSFTSAANITITANASDPDGSINLVEFYNGSTKLGSKSTAPYSFNWNNVAAGTYSLKVIATDNLNTKTTSSAISISVINSNPAPNKHPIVKISNPRKGNTYENLSTIEIDATASDPDGTISKVEFYNGETDLVGMTSAPYTYIWKDVAAGRYLITAIATDNSNDTTISSPVEFEVGALTKYDANSEIVNLYPNPSDGHFSIKFINPLQSEKSEIIITDLAGKQVYNAPVLKEEILKQLDLSNSKSGIYVMMIKDKDILVTKKFIIN